MPTQGNDTISLMRIVTLVLFSLGIAFAQRPFSGAPEIKQALEKLNVVGTALMIAAHPDDENTAVIAELARGKKVRTAYLSLNRGEGGQNLIGSEQGVEMGVIRTQELLGARRIDGGEQFFTRTIDFGFSKNAPETFEKWGGREEVLRDVVWVIRKFRPDVIVRRFSGTPRDGHGNHTASGLLADEAFVAAADPKRFPEQLKFVEPWQAKRLVWNMAAFTLEQEAEIAKLGAKITLDTGIYDPLLGYSYSEIAGISRSAHKSQAMGSPERKGSQKNYLMNIAGERPKSDLWEGIDTTWSRIPGGAKIGEHLAKALANFKDEKPAAILPDLLAARNLVAGLNDHYSVIKRRDLDETIAMVTGLWAELQAEKFKAVQGSTSKLRLTAIARGAAAITLQSVDFNGAPGAANMTLAKALPANEPFTQAMDWKVPANAPLSQPYYLVEPRAEGTYKVSDYSLLGLPEGPAPLVATLKFLVDGTEIELTRGVTNRFVDRIAGEQTRPVIVVPEVSVRLAQDALLFPAREARRVEVVLKSNQANVSGSLKLSLPAGWSAEPSTREFTFKSAEEERALSFSVTPTAAESTGTLNAVAVVNGKEISNGTKTIAYPHIPPQTLAPRAQAKLVRANVKNLAKKVGYIMGAGDEVPEALQQLGCEVTMLSAEDLAVGNLNQYDAIVTGVRAFNTRADLRANVQRIYDDYVAKGGTYIVQYNVLEGGFMGGDPSILANVGPYPMTPSRDRVTSEISPVSFPRPDDRLLQFPNQISVKDFEGWVQERGLYFPSKWDDKYQPLFSTFDPGEKPQNGGTLVTKYGQGTYIFTGYAWFRQLPAGVPGAFRIFSNFLSAGKN